MAGPAAIPAADVTPPAAGYGAPAQVAFRERLLIAVLFVAVLASSFAFIEPSPHDLLMGMLGLAGLAAGIRFHRILLVPYRHG